MVQLGSCSMTKILIVDDSPTIRRMVAASLQALEEVFFEEASNGLEAIETLARERINLMILDLNMPDMHGLEVLQFIRTHNQYRDLPIIVLTTRYDAESRKAAIERGASRFLTKPFEPTVLRQHAASLLETK
jgi:two-component system, chemotaxis family, chemotaxis protein CheY